MIAGIELTTSSAAANSKTSATPKKLTYLEHDCSLSVTFKKPFDQHPNPPLTDLPSTTKGANLIHHHSI